MSDNMKLFLEKVSQDPTLTEKLQQANAVPELMELAASLGITLTEADFSKDEEICDDELDAVAGGVDNCYCPALGGGSKTDRGKTCACILGGGGEYISGGARCVCVAMGIGENGYGQ